jgi:hypothetical protein
MKLCWTKTLASWFLQILVAGILFQTLFFKFSGAPESKYIFTTLGVEPWGRIASGAIELVAGVLLLMPRTVVFGAGIALAVMAGAIGAHLTRLGLIVQDDSGLLFIMAVTVFVLSGLILGFRRAQIPIVGRFFNGAAHSCATGTCRLH